MSLIKKVFVLFVVCFSFVNAEVLKDIKFSGLYHMSNDNAREVLGLHIGSEIDYQEVDSALKQLFAQGYFQNIRVDEDFGVLTFRCIEKPTIAHIKISNFDTLKEEDALKMLRLKKGMMYDEKKIKNAQKELRTFLEFSGFLDSVVDVKTTKINDNSLSLELIAVKGDKIIIKDVDFAGADIFGYDDFADVISNKQRQSFGWLWGRDDGELKLPELGKDFIKVKDFYLSKGYLDSKVSQPLLKADLASSFAHISYDISEGEVYKVKHVGLKLDVDDVSVDQTLLSLSAGDVFDVFKLRADMKLVQTALFKNGYAYAKVEPDFAKDDINRTISIDIKTISGKKVYIGDIRIKGNSNTLDKVIRRELYLIPGSLFSQTDYDDSIRVLKQSGYFEDVKIEKKFVNEQKIDFVVDVQEAPTGSLVGSFGYGSDGLLLSGNVRDRNLFGSGIEVGVSLDTSSTTTKGEIFFQNPRLNDSSYSLGGSIFKRDYDTFSFDEERVGFNLNIGKRFTRLVTASLSYALEDITLSSIDDNVSSIFDIGTNLKSSITPSISYNSTDDFFLPREGISASGSIEHAGLGGDIKFNKLGLNMNYFYGLRDLIDYDLILRYKSTLKVVSDDGFLPINEKLYLGGIRSLRGFETNSLSPKNTVGDLIGGRKLFSNSFEFSIPIVESMKMRFFGFFDYGLIGESNFDDITRSSFGYGIEWLSGLGPIQLIFANPNSKSGDETSKFDFTIGSRF